MTDQWRAFSILAAAVFAGLLLLIGPASAQGVDPFTVEDVRIDARAADTQKARRRALAAGRAAAFRQLLRRLAHARDYGKLPRIADTGIIEMIDGFSVREEKSSAVRYLALMTVRFKPGPVRALLKEAGIAYVDTTSRPILVLPILRAGKRTTLWEPPNPWRDAWGRAPLQGGLVPFVLALGDLGDLSAIDAKSALAGNRKKLEAIAGRYNAGEVLVALAREIRTAKKAKNGKTTGKPRLLISLWRFVPLTGALKPAGRFTASRGEDDEARFLAAATGVARRIENSWKRENQAIVGGVAETVRVNVAIESLGQWTEIRQRISEVSVVKETVVIQLSRYRAELELRYVGGLERLRAGLAQRNIAMIEQPASGDAKAPGWLLRLGAAKRGGVAGKPGGAKQGKPQ